MPRSPKHGSSSATGDDGVGSYYVWHEPGKKFVCVVCSHMTTRKYDIERHCKTHLPDGHPLKRTYKCPNCDCPKNTQGYEQKINLMTHIKTKHEGKKPSICPTCGVQYSWEDKLILHREKKHEYTPSSRAKSEKFPGAIQNELDAPPREDKHVSNGDAVPNRQTFQVTPQTSTDTGRTDIPLASQPIQGSFPMPRSLTQHGENTNILHSIHLQQNYHSEQRYPYPEPSTGASAVHTGSNFGQQWIQQPAYSNNHTFNHFYNDVLNLAQAPGFGGASNQQLGMQPEWPNFQQANQSNNNAGNYNYDNYYSDRNISMITNPKYNFI